MAHKVHFGLTSIGVSFVVVAYSFLGCYGTRTTEMGKCEDDGNPCTIDSCESGGTLHLNAPDNAGCSLGENAGKCSMGRCVLACETDPTQCKCSEDSNCPLKEDCAEWKCDTAAGRCQKTITNEGLPGGMQTPGDCLVNTCMDGALVATNAELGTICDTGACNGSGACVDCLSATDWTSCGGAACPVKMCNGEAATDAANCQSGNAADGVCCDTACTDVCKSCNAMGATKGICSNIAYYQPDPAYIDPGSGTSTKCDPSIAGGFCDGQGRCLKASGTLCQTGMQCLSGVCSPNSKCLGAQGEICLAGIDCVSGTCMMGTCK